MKKSEGSKDVSDEKRDGRFLYPYILHHDTIGEVARYMMEVWDKRDSAVDNELKRNMRFIETIMKIQYAGCIKHPEVFLYGLDPRFLPGNQDIPFAMDVRGAFKGDTKEYDKNNEILVGRQLIITRIGDFEISKGSMCNLSKVDFQQIQAEIKKEFKLGTLNIVNHKYQGDMIQLKLPFQFRLYPYVNILDYMSFPPKVEPRRCRSDA
jgi:hypothetical protein